jgi:UBX domain-containing protein 1
MDSEALSQFVSLTNSTPDAAKFFLESANGDVEAAIDQYYASGGQAQQEESVPAAVEQHQAAAATAITPATVAAAASAPAKKPAAGKQATRLIRSLGRLDLAMQAMPGLRCGDDYIRTGCCNGIAGKATRPTGGVRSLADVARDAQDSDEDDDEGNEYYAGGQKR